MKAVVDVGSRPALVSIPRIRNLSTPPAPEASEKQVRFVPKGLISTRKRLGLSAAELAKLLEVSAQTIYNWERGATKPSAVQRAKLVSLRGIGKRQLQAHLAEQEAR